MKTKFTLFTILLLLCSISIGFTQTSITIGTGTSYNSTYDYPAPYGNYYWGSRQQYLIQKSEMFSAGATNGGITSLAFNVAGPSNVNLNGFTIKIGHTADTALDYNFVSGLTQVYSVSSYKEVFGWNEHVFQTPFVWDGVNNIVVEVCFNNTSYTNNGQTYYTNTSFNSSFVYNDDATGVCSSNQGGSSYNKRPNIRFQMLPPSPNDLSVMALIAPNPHSANVPNSNQPVNVWIGNRGSVAQDTFNIGYSINGGINYVNETYNGTINPGDTLNYTFTATANMGVSGYYPMIVYVANQGDAYSYNDTIHAGIPVCNPFSGTFTLGTGTGKDFQTFNDVAGALTTCGISGPVTILVDPGTYNEKVYIRNISGSSAINTVTFTSSTGNPSDVILTNDNNTYGDDYTIKLDGVQYLTIKNMTLQTANNYYNTVVRASNFCHHIVLYNNIIKSVNFGGDGKVVNFMDVSNSLIRKNVIINGYNGIDLSTDSYMAYNIQNKIDSNNIQGFSNSGIYAYYQDRLNLSANSISSNSTNYTVSGISIYNSRNNIKVLKNRIVLSGKQNVVGISDQYNNQYLTSDTSVLASVFANNFVSANSSENGNVIGLQCYYSEKVKYVYNSFLVEGNNSYSKALDQSGDSYNGVSQVFMNNIFANKTGGYAAYFNNAQAIANSDYNNYYAPNSTYLVYSSGFSFSAIGVLKTTGKDSNSVSINPLFVSSSNLHSTSISMADKGTPLFYVTDDIDNQTRSASTPDIGADEYAPPANNLSLINVYSSTVANEEMCNLGSETIVVDIVNNGTATQTSFPISFKINNQSTVTETWTGSLATGDTISYQFTALGNFTPAGKTNFIVYTGLANDENKSDDTLDMEFNIYQSITVPFIDNFENRNNLYYHLESQEQARVVIDTIHGLNSESAIYMIGGDYYSNWNYYGSDILAAIQSNSKHLVKASLCPFDATSLSNLRMTFQVDQNHVDNYSNFFFIKINDSLFAKSTSGDSVWTDFDNISSLTIDLSPFVGGMITVSFQAILRTNQEYYFGDVDDITIDNLKIYVPQPIDVGVYDIGSSNNTRCGSVSDSIFLVIKNYGTTAQYNIPVVADILWGTNNYYWTATYTDTLQPDETDNIYVGILNTTQNVYMDIAAYTALSTDQNKFNDTLKIAGDMKNYEEIPYIETFENNNYHWSMYDFYIQYYQYNGQDHHFLFIESYSNGEAYENPPQSQSGAYAFNYETVGIVGPNSYLVYDYSFFNKNNYTDTIVFVIDNSCSGGDNFQFLAPLTNVNNVTLNQWNKGFIPLSNYVGDKVRIGLVKMLDPNENSEYSLALDNIGIINATPVSLGNDTAVCYGSNYAIQTGLSASNGLRFQWMGPGVTSTDTLSYLNVNQSGYYQVVVTDSIGFMTSDDINIMVYPQITAGVNATDTTLCFGDSTKIMVNFTGGFPISFNWNDGTTTYSDTAFGPITERFFKPNTTKTFTLTTAMDVNGCVKSINDDITLIVNSLPTVSASGLLSQYCHQDSSTVLAGVPTGGVFMGNGLTGNLFDPSMAGSGNHNIIYSYTNSNGCKNSDTLQTTVYNNPVVAIVSIPKPHYCANDPVETFFAFPTGGVFTGQGMTANVFNPASAGIGIDTITYTFTDVHNCTSTDRVTFNVNSIPAVSISTMLNAAYCQDAASVALSASPTGGVFSGNGVSGSTFNPSVALIGNSTIIYNYTDGNGCKNSDTISTSINPLPNVLITTQFASGYCQDGSVVNLSGYPSGGTFSGSGVSGNSFLPNSANLGLNTITYSYTNAQGCSKSDSVQVTVYAQPAPVITSILNASYCADAASVTLTASPSGGSFSGNGVTGNNFNPSSANTGSSNIIYSYTGAGGCKGYDTISTMVYPVPTVLITTQFASGYCQDGSSVNLSGYPSGGSFTGNGVTGAIFYADSTTAGSHNVVYSYTDIHGCTNSDTKQITVFALPTVSLGNFADVCADVNQLQLTGGLPSGGHFSGIAVNSNNGLFYPSAFGVGNNIITYTYADANGCANTANKTIKVIGIPTANFNIPATVCKGDTITVNYTGNASSAANFNWGFYNPQVVIGSASGPYQVRWDTASIKALSLVVTDSGCVSPTYNNYTNVMEAIAMITTVGGSSACYGDSVLLFANSGPGYSFQWYDTSGMLTLPDDTLAYYYATTSGSYYAQITNNLGCSAFSNPLGVTVYPELLSNFSLPAAACKDDMVNINYLSTGDVSAVYNWNFNNGTIASGSAFGPYSIVWNTDSIKTVSLQVTKDGCSSTLTQKLINIVTTPASITALGPTSFCDGGSVTLYPNSGSNLSYLWFKNGVSLGNNGSFYTATQTGQYSVKVTNTLLGCTNTSAPVQVTNNTTNFNLAFTANQTNFTLPPFNVHINNQTADTTDYYWAWSFGDGGVSTMSNPNHQYQYDGTYTVGVVAQNILTGCYDTLVKNNYITCSGGSANPCTLVATISPAGPKAICPGDSIKLSAALNAGATYQWLKDGVLIQGADTTFYWAKQTGNYQVMVTNSICSQFSNPFSLTMYNTLTPTIASNGSITPCTLDSMELYVTSSFNSYLWSNGAQTSNIFVMNSSNYTVTATDANGCKTVSAPFVVNASLLPTPEICIVGVDSATNTNLIVWERHANPLIDSFRVYRESSVAGVYNLLGSTSVNDPGIYYDLNSNARQQAYRYKITAVDTCGMETPPSNYHKTIHLSINAGLNGSWNLIWSHYVGFNFGSYRIYRGFDSTALQPLTQIQSTLNSFTDLNPPTGNVYYQIEVVSPHPCYPDSVYSKAKTNYNTSRSNNVSTAMAGSIGINEQLASDYKVFIYPNPNKGQFDIELMSVKGGEFKLSIRDVLGQELFTQENLKVNGYLMNTIDLGKPAPGVYFLTVENNNQRIVKKIVIN